tara:strand:+ start:4243 stop:5019 length:777 start_codon:yes stop_codon:yes gene_type:complete
MENKKLTKLYDKIFKEGSNNFFTFNVFEESLLLLGMLKSWQNLEILEIGCGEGKLASMMSYAGAKSIDAVDYSEEAINLCKDNIKIKNVNYIYGNYKKLEKKYDVVVMQGVLEHMDKPFEELKYILDNMLKSDGCVVTSSPSFLNPRGYVWMTLQTLFDVPMSLTDLHFLCPFDFEQFCEKNNCFLELKSGYQDWGSGDGLIKDFNKRLRNALRDADMDNTKVDKLLSWLSKSTSYFNQDEHSGAIVSYKIRRKNENY